MTNNKFAGTGVALVTPFNSDNKIDFDAFTKLMDHVISGGVDYLVALGTTSESSTLNELEKRKVVQFIIDYNASRLPVILGLGGNNTRQLADKIRDSSLDGIDAILSVVPYYNKPTQNGLILHFKKLADESPVPLILYNVPGRTSSNITANTTLKLAEHSNIVAIKEASGDLEQCAIIAANSPSDFSLISGDDLSTLPILSIGGVGVISVIANALPVQFCEMVNCYLNGNTSDAVTSFHQMVEITRLIFEEGNPAGVKELLNQLEVCENGVRLPLVSASKELINRIRKELLKK